MQKYLLLLFLGLTTAGFAQDEFDITIEEEPKTRSATGSFGQRLAKEASFVNFNGYITNEFKSVQGGDPSFDQHYFNVFISSQLTSRISVEGQLEYEHAGKDIDLRYGFADYELIEEALIIRSGKFLVPAGEFNEYLYPEYLSKTVERAYVNREITPSAWGEVGVQARGRLTKLSPKVIPYYSVYVVNGLHGEEGAGIRDLRGNDRDKSANGNKAIGANLGIEVANIKFSTNYYQGKYTNDNQLGLSILGTSFYMDREKLSIWSEAHTANQQIFTDIDQDEITSLRKYGYYVLAGYKVTERWEPVIRYDQIVLDGAPEADRNRLTLGLNYHIAKNAVVKTNYDIIQNGGEDVEDNQFSLQLSIGF
ncbi:MAG: hypothetical protein AAF223_04550 [Bacteroidota bacterium]